MKLIPYIHTPIDRPEIDRGFSFQNTTINELPASFLNFRKNKNFQQKFPIMNQSFVNQRMFCFPGLNMRQPKHQPMSIRLKFLKQLDVSNNLPFFSIQN